MQQRRSVFFASCGSPIRQILLVAQSYHAYHAKGCNSFLFDVIAGSALLLTETEYAYQPRKPRRRSRRLSLTSIFNQAKAETQ